MLRFLLLALLLLGIGQARAQINNPVVNGVQFSGACPSTPSPPAITLSGTLCLDTTTTPPTLRLWNATTGVALGTVSSGGVWTPNIPASTNALLSGIQFTGACPSTATPPSVTLAGTLCLDDTTNPATLRLWTSASGIPIGTLSSAGVWIPAGAASGATNPVYYYAQSYAPAGYVFGTLTASNNPTTLAAFYGSLAAAQAVYPIATSLGNYVDRIVVQTAINAAVSATPLFAVVVLPPGGIPNTSNCGEFWDAQVSYDSYKVGLTGGGGDPGGTTVICTQSVPTGTAALQVTSSQTQNYGREALSNITFHAWNQAMLYFPATNGSAVAGGSTPYNGSSGGYFYTNSIALQITGAAVGTMSHVSFLNYDQPHAWGPNTYIWTFKDFYYSNNDYGVYMGSAQSNSFENMVWQGGVTGNNNYNAYFSLSGGGGSIFLNQMSNDYPALNCIYYDGLGAGNDTQIPLYVNGGHIETASATTGTGNARIYNNGDLFLTGVNGTEQGTFPSQWINAGFYSRTHLANVTVPGENIGSGNTIPVVYAGSNVNQIPTASGLSNRYGGDVILLSEPIGQLVARPGQVGFYANEQQPQSASYTLGLANQPYVQYASANLTVTIPPDSTTNQIIGTKITFVPASGVTITFSAGAGVTLVGATTATAPTTLYKTAANTWQH